MTVRVAVRLSPAMVSRKMGLGWVMFTWALSACSGGGGSGGTGASGGGTGSPATTQGDQGLCGLMSMSELEAALALPDPLVVSSPDSASDNDLSMCWYESAHNSAYLGIRYERGVTADDFTHVRADFVDQYGADEIVDAGGIGLNAFSVTLGEFVTLVVLDTKGTIQIAALSDLEKEKAVVMTLMAKF